MTMNQMKWPDTPKAKRRFPVLGKTPPLGEKLPKGAELPAEAATTVIAATAIAVTSAASAAAGTAPLATSAATATGAAAESTTAAAGRPLFARAGLVNRQFAAVECFPADFVNGAFGLFGRRHCYEGKAPGPSGLAIIHHDHFDYFANLGKQVAQRILRGAEGNVSNKKFGCHVMCVDLNLPDAARTRSRLSDLKLSLMHIN